MPVAGLGEIEAGRGRRRKLRSLGSAIAMLAAIGGCGKESASGGGADPNLVVLTKLYADHLNANQGRAPQHEREFKAFIRQHGAHRLEGADASELDAIFGSTRDKKPLVLVYGDPPDPRRQSTVVAYEQSAVAGKRSVGYRYGTSELVDEAKFLELIPAAGSAKP